MNERIKLLIEQATTSIDPTAHDGVCWDFDKEKFAELIVQECIDQLCVSDPTEDFDNGVTWAAQQIKEHFRVEE